MTHCRKHPKYRAIRRPRVDCRHCWRMYTVRHGAAKALRKYAEARDRAVS